MPILLEAEPAPLPFDPRTTALVVIDMQRDFLEPGGFGESLGNDVGLLAAAVPPCRTLLAAARAAGLLVVHTREGHEPDLSDAPPAKLERGEPGHDIVPDLAPWPGEPVIDKPGKGAFYATDLAQVLEARAIATLLVCGVTTEVCVHTTVREANDRGYRCVVVSDACGSYIPEFHAAGLAMIKAQGGIFGWVSDSATVAAALNAGS